MTDPESKDKKDDRTPIGPLDCGAKNKRRKKPVELSYVNGKAVYGRLTVDQLVGAIAHCTCSCGTKRAIEMRSLRNGNTRSCGCLGQETRSSNGKRNRTHGMKKTPTYKAWDSMKQRCLNPNNKSYIHYGARGITFCESWLVFENFLADMGERPGDLTLERIDVDGNYEPGNCCWATQKEQTRNRRITVSVEIDGRTRILGEVCEEYGISAHLVHSRLRYGWAINEALRTPVIRSGYSRRTQKECRNAL